MNKLSNAASAAHRQRWLETVDAAMRQSGYEAAARLALQAVTEGVEHPALLNLAGLARYDEGRFAKANVELSLRYPVDDQPQVVRQPRP